MPTTRRQFLASSTAAAVALRTRPFFAQSSPGEIILSAPIANPFYAWPRTLLAYANPAAKPSALLCVETNKIHPTQLSASGELLFFSDLPTGATRTFKPASTASDTGPKVTIRKDERGYVVDSGSIQVRLPATQSVAAKTPGPIMEVSRDGGRTWTGASTISLPAASIATEQLEAGPLRSTHRITYTLSSGAKYIATVQCTAGMDYVRLHEDMATLAEAPLGEFVFTWTGQTFTHRQAPDHPYSFPRTIAPRFADYPWEELAPAHMDTQFGVASGLDAGNRLPFAIRLFDPWQDQIAASYASFWSNTSPDAAAIFIDHIEQIEDHEYAIWHSSPRLAVEFVVNTQGPRQELSFVYKLGRGSRSTCLSFYDHALDLEAMKFVEEQSRGVMLDRIKFSNSLYPTSHSHDLQQWHGTLSLDKTKDWIVTRPPGAARPKPLFTVSAQTTPDALYRTMLATEFPINLATSGTRQNHGFGPTSSRQIQESWVPGYQIHYDKFTPAQRRVIEGVFLTLAYVHAGEDYMPMQRMLAGHPNFLADVKSVPPAIAFLFPDHPQADTWADEYECYLHLNSRYHTRPDVAAWNARGGRWTENLGTYVWAFLRPSFRASFMLKQRDGIERFCTPQVAQVADWLVNALSAPFNGESAATMQYVRADAARNEGSRRHYWGIVAPEEGPRRLHPPQGAHSERRKTPRSMYLMGLALRNYRPLVAEHLMWASRPTDMDMEAPVEQYDAFGAMGAGPDNRGTNPHLRTAKYTGYGVTLRASVDTPQELSVHLLQIDDGPNYRWGAPSEGGCGTIYFYANGKGYSHNGGEDVGDRIDQDTDFGTNFGVWKGNTYRAIGQNVLHRPLYDLGAGQFAEIVPRENDSYSWPEYVSRNIMLAGDDYFLVWDKVFNPQVAHRFSWFVRKGDDFPHISMLGQRHGETGGMTSIETEVTSGRWVDGFGDSLALITHKPGIAAQSAPFGGRIGLPGGGVDLLFAVPKPIDFKEGPHAFAGTAGLIRTHADRTGLVLFHGSLITGGGLSIATADHDLGISATIRKGAPITGCYFAPASSEVSLTFENAPSATALYVDGASMGQLTSGHITAKLPAGEHTWELTSTSPTPVPPVVTRTDYTRGGAMVHANAVASATAYSAELSKDGGATWTAAGAASASPVVTLTGLNAGSKYHVRLIAANGDRRSAPGPEYPLYITASAPPAPDGLHVALAQGSAVLTWGEILGAGEYRVYRKAAPDKAFKVVYAGPLQTWTDTNAAIVAPAASPVDTRPGPKDVVCEYYVTAVNQLGESQPSRRADTDPASWRNWNPTGDEPFRRTVERTEGRLPNDGGGRYYPA